jgi:hypothetical protein
MRSETLCEEVAGTSYVVRDLKYGALRFYWCTEKWRKDYQKCIALVMNKRGMEGKVLHVN